jgi:hypothetical protein
MDLQGIKPRFDLGLTFNICLNMESTSEKDFSISDSASVGSEGSGTDRMKRQ